MQKIDYNREFSKLLLIHIKSLNLNQNSLFSLLSFIFENYRFDIKFLFRLNQLSEKYHYLENKFTPSLSGDEEKGE